MELKYPGLRARRECAERTGAELRAYQPKRPLAPRDEGRLKVMRARCSTCAACPQMVRTLRAMLPPTEAPVSARIFRLAG